MSYDTTVYEEWLMDARRRLSDTTVKGYKYRIKHFLKWIKAKNITITMVDKNTMREYGNHLYDTRMNDPKTLRDGVSEAQIESSIGGRLSSLNHFFDFLYDIDTIPQNPITKRLKSQYPANPQPESYPKIPLDQVRTLYHGLEGQYMKQILVATLVDTGIRPRELCLVDIDHLDIPGRELEVKYGKGRKGKLPRMSILSKTLAGLLKQYLPYREELPSRGFKDNQGRALGGVKQTSEALFTNKLGGRFKEHTLRHLWNAHKTVITKDGIKKATERFEGSDCHRLGLPKLNPRRFRPTYSTWLDDTGIDMKVGYMQLGHKHRDVHLNVYLQRNNEERHAEHERVGSILVKILR